MDSVIFSRIKGLCERNEISVTQLESELGLSSGSIGKWRTSVSPSVDKIYKVAKYFGVSLDYLVGASDLETTADQMMEDEDIVSIQRARERLSDRDKDRMMQMIRIGFDFAFDDADEEITN